MVAFASIASLALLASGPALALDNGLGLKPALGWNSWNLFNCDITEDIVKGMVDTIIKLGLDKIGYEYVNLDDCWQIDRDEDGYIVVDKDKFPSGMKALGDYIHSKGLKFGTYSSAGTYTCQKRPGSLLYEKEDAIKYAEWGVDYLKLDNCYNEGMGSKAGTIIRYGRMRDALNATGRPILFSLCNWGESKSWEYAVDLGNSWRTTFDICDAYDGVWCSAMSLLDSNADIVGYSAPGGFNDMDMLEVGNGGMNIPEYRSHFSAWSALKSPLLLGNDLRSMSPEIFDIISNTEVIAVNQDPLGVSAKRVMKTDDGMDVWSGPLSNGDRVLMVLNRGDEDVESFEIGLELIFGEKGEKKENVTRRVVARDLWKKKNIGTFTNVINVAVPRHDVAMLRVTLPEANVKSLSTDPPAKGTPEDMLLGVAAMSLILLPLLILGSILAYRLFSNNREGSIRLI
ncbi:hypothetical protein HDU97_001601 [Phlyctochytrium planicorne]|nr:hypothetical protein HDU97_001601 [Phlyctochytrium planicorne]